jgi:hypothetical protein
MYLVVSYPQKSCTVYIPVERQIAIHPTIIHNLFFQQLPPSAAHHHGGAPAAVHCLPPHPLLPILHHHHHPSLRRPPPNPTPRQGEIRRGEGRGIDFLFSYFLACVRIISHTKLNLIDIPLYSHYYEDAL